VPSGGGAERIGREVDAHAAGERVGDDQRGRGEVVRLDGRMDASLEVPVARQHRGDDQVARVDRGVDPVVDRPGVADARGAAVPDQVEAEPVQVRLQPGALQVVRDDLAARREGRFDPRLDGQPAPERVACDQAGGEHHGGVRGVRAARDRGDDDVAVGHVVGAAVDRDRSRRAVLARLGEGPAERRRDAVEGHPVLGPLRTGQAWLDGAEVELQCLREDRHRRRLVVPEPLGLGIGLDQRDSRRVAAREREVPQRLGVDREQPAGGAVLWRHVADRRPILDAQRADPRAEELDELAYDAVAAQQLRDGQDEVGRGRAFPERPGQLDPDHVGHQHRDRLPEHRGLRLDPADAPAEHAQSVDHGGVAVRPDEGVRIGDHPAVPGGGGPHDLGEVLEIDLVADPGAGRHDAEVLKRRLPPAEERVALLVALEFPLDVGRKRAFLPEHVNHHRMVDHQIDRRERVDLAGVPAEGRHRVAHRGEVDDRGHAGEVLHQHPRRTKHDLPRGSGRPRRQRLHIVGADGAAVLAAQQVLEQDLQGVRQPGDGPEARLGQRRQAEVVIRRPADGQHAARLERIPTKHGRCGHTVHSFVRRARPASRRRCLLTVRVDGSDPRGASPWGAARGGGGDAAGSRDGGHARTWRGRQRISTSRSATVTGEAFRAAAGRFLRLDGVRAAPRSAARGRPSAHKALP